MKARTIFTGLFIFLAAAGCDEPEPVQDGMVSFSEENSEINVRDTQSLAISLSINPPAPANSEIGILVPLRSVGVQFTVDPEPESNEVLIPVEEGATSSELQITLNPDRFEEGSTLLDFEVFYVGPGLNAELLDGRFFTLTVNNPGEELPEDFEVPYRENFEDCFDGGFPPNGWAEQVVEQNNLESANWTCISGGAEINAFVPDSDDTSPSEVWLLSPTITLNASQPVLSFDVDRRFEPADPNLIPYDLLISTDYQGNFDAATWNRFEPGFNAIEADDPNADGYSDSGNLDLSNFAGEDITVAFVYRAGAVSTTAATIFRISNFTVDNAPE